MKRKSSLKYLLFTSKYSSKTLPYMFDDNIEHKVFMELIKESHIYSDLEVIAGGFIDYNEETKQFSTIGKSISCRVESSPDDIKHFSLAAASDGDMFYWE